MPGFKFELSQLVMVPGKNQQGRISGRMEFVNDETVYQVKWLDDDLNVYTEMFKERDLVETQDQAVIARALDARFPEFPLKALTVAEEMLKRGRAATRKRTPAKRSKRRAKR